MAKKIPDLRYIDGMRIVTVVKEYQATKNEAILKKIVKHFDPFKDQWAKQLSKSGDLSPLDALKMHDNIVAASAKKFKCDWLVDDTMSDEHQEKSKAFDAYVVSALLDQVKSLVCQRRAAKSCYSVKA